MPDKFITFAIHTSQQALALKRILNAHDIEVRIQKMVVSGAPIAIGVKVMIKEKDLPIALKVSESILHFENPNIDTVMSGHIGELLIPVDFNDYCLEACRAGFKIASHLNLRPVILHAFPSPVFNPSFTTDDTSSWNIDSNIEEEFTEIELSKDFHKQARRNLKELIDKIKFEQKENKLPDIQFDTKLEDGVPEDVIKNYCKMNPPNLIVMITRGKEKKDEQLIGSVTAEVLDDCKVPLLSIPENCDFKGINKIKELVFFCNMDQHDLISVDTFMRMFEYPEVNITLIPLYEKPDKDLKTKLIRLRDYFNKTYPSAEFSTAIFPPKTFMLDFNNYEAQRGTEMIVAPNRRRNAIMRLFNPGIAHRLLFERDLPLLALPI